MDKTPLCEKLNIKRLRPLLQNLVFVFKRVVILNDVFIEVIKFYAE